MASSVSRASSKARDLIEHLELILKSGVSVAGGSAAREQAAAEAGEAMQLRRQLLLKVSFSMEDMQL